MDTLPWFANYSGETTEQLLKFEGRYRTDSLMVAFDQAIGLKQHRGGGLNDSEVAILAIVALENEVNNGGFRQFFGNSSAEYAPRLVDALKRIDCPKTALIAQRAIDGLGLSELSIEAIQKTMRTENAERDERLLGCDSDFYGYEENLAEKLIRFIRLNPRSIRIP